jgi:hypothetical protein
MDQAKRTSFLAITKNGIKFHMEQLQSMDARLEFLTDIFFLAEELRHEIFLSESDPAEEARLRDKIEAIRSQALGENGTHRSRNGRRKKNTRREQISKEDKPKQDAKHIGEY